MEKIWSGLPVPGRHLLVFLSLQIETNYPVVARAYSVCEPGFFADAGEVLCRWYHRLQITGKQMVMSSFEALSVVCASSSASGRKRN